MATIRQCITGIKTFHPLNHITRSLSSQLFKLKVLDGNLDGQNSSFQEGQKLSQVVQDALLKTYARVYKGGGEKGIHRHTVVNRKILPRERMKMLFDGNSEVLEIGTLAGLSMDYGDIPGAAGIVAIGKINGHFSVAMLSDATVKAGAVYPIGVVKQLRSQQIAFANNLPCIYMVDSAGAFLPLQADIFPDRDHGGRSFYNQAILSENDIPQIVVVCGSCTAGAAYIPTMSEQTVIVKGIGLVYLAGPPLVKAATGEVVTDEDLGGADVHCSISGCTDYYAEDEQEAIDMARDILLTYNLDDCLKNTKKSKAVIEPLYDQSELAGIAGQLVITKENIYQILSRILDGSKFHEFKTKFGRNLITGFGFIENQLVGILANSGAPTAADALKGANFISLCDRRHIPIIFLQNSADVKTSISLSSKENGIVLKERGKMIAAHSCATVPKITINVGGCLGDDNFTMCGSAFQPNFMFSWPLAQTSLSPNGVERIQNPDQFNIDDEFECQSSAFFQCSRMQQDGIILPQDTRKILSLCIEVSMCGYYRRLFSKSKKHSTFFRM